MQPLQPALGISVAVPILPPQHARRIVVEDAAADELPQQGVIRDQVEALQGPYPAEESQQPLRLDVARRSRLDLLRLRPVLERGHS